ncbi:MAG: type IX secretion system membrane protein PorP/SprF [Bacteroidales bacterium]|nr:type IX secretion system membrane protein PorP/SprF [Bacteroidales bacterium]
MKKLGIIVMAGILSIAGFAQQDAQFSINMFNHLTYNPGYAGYSDQICTHAVARKQWAGFDNAPSTMLFNVNAPIPGNNGVGLNVIKDKIGFEDNLMLNGIFSHLFPVGKGNLGVGISLGFINRSLSADWISYSSLTGEGAGQNVYSDEIIPHDGSKLGFDMGFGIYYNATNYYAGISSTHINRSQLKYEENINPFNQRHVFLTGGYYFDLSDGVSQIMPSVFVESDGASTQYLISGTYIYARKYWAGLAYRTTDAVILMMGIDFQQGYGIGYAYDFSTSQMSKHTSGSHEIIFRYCFSMENNKGQTKYTGPRNLGIRR